MWACEYGRTAVVELLLERGVEVGTSVDGMTGLHWAANNWQLDTIRLLLDRGAPLETRNAYGGTVLGQAIWSVFNSDPVWRWPRTDADYAARAGAAAAERAQTSTRWASRPRIGA